MKLVGKFPFKNRLKTFLASYHLRIEFPNGSSAFVGRGSVGLIGHFCHFSGAVPEYPLITIGNFCESAEARIILDGEHRNDKIFNNSLGDFPMAREALRQKNNELWRSSSKNKTEIGHGVTLSIESVVLSGARIGNGAVIGAGAIVASTISEFYVAAGNPCKDIKARLNKTQIEIAKEIRWWDFDVEFFIKHSAMLLDTERNYEFLKTHAVYDEKNIKVVLSYIKSPEFAAPMTVKVIGVDVDSKFYPIGEMPQVSKYFRQLYAPESNDLTWVPCIFSHIKNS